MESRAQAKELSGRKNPLIRQKRDVDRTKVGKCMSQLSRKAAIVIYVPVP